MTFSDLQNTTVVKSFLNVIPFNNFIQSCNFLFIQFDDKTGLKVAVEKHDEEKCTNQPGSVKQLEPHEWKSLWFGGFYS